MSEDRPVSQKEGTPKFVWNQSALGLPIRSRNIGDNSRFLVHSLMRLYGTSKGLPLSLHRRAKT